MKNISKLYIAYRKDVKQILKIKKENTIVDKICLLSWKVSFMPKEQRIEEILLFVKNSSDNIPKELQQYNILELILSLSHFRRAKYQNV